MARAVAIFARSSVINAMSAASSAACVPPPPIAIPTSASANAGASLIPSPVIAPVALLLQFGNHCNLVLRHQICANLIHPDFCRNGFCGGRVVARQHDDPLDAGLFQVRQRFTSTWSQGVGNEYH